MARALFGGLIAFLIASQAQSNLRNEVAEVLKAAFNTTEQVYKNQSHGSYCSTPTRYEWLGCCVVEG